MSGNLESYFVVTRVHAPETELFINNINQRSVELDVMVVLIHLVASVLFESGPVLFVSR